jgi:hypothetical protein
LPPGYPSPSKRLINEPTLPAVDGDRECMEAVYPERLRLMLLSDDAARGVPIWNIAARAALPMELPVFMGAALPVLMGTPLLGGPGGERERPVDGGAFDMALAGALAGALEDEAAPGLGGGERDLGAEGGGCDFAGALAFGAPFGGGGPGGPGGGPLGAPLGAPLGGGGPLGAPLGAPGAPRAPRAPAPMSAATLAVNGVSARMFSVRSRSMRSVRAMPWSRIRVRSSTRASCFCWRTGWF